MGIAVNKIHIEPKSADVKPSDEYVYIHYKLDEDVPMYVGKGVGRRGFSAVGRNKRWRYTAAKHGVRVEICDQGLTTEQAYTLEMWLIAKLRHEGYDLCNMTDGGEGRAGFESEKRREVFCSNGMKFTHAEHAADWLRSIGHTGATSKIVSACALGRKKSIYGYAFSHDGTPVQPLFTGRDAQSFASSQSGIPVYSSDGFAYQSAQSAAEAMGGSGGGKILAACRGVRLTAYGLTWSFSASGPFPEYVDPMTRSNMAKRKRVRNDAGDEFASISMAAEWLSKLRGRPYSQSAIQRALGRGGKCGGFRWFRLDKKKGE